MIQACNQTGHKPLRFQDPNLLEPIEFFVDEHLWSITKHFHGPGYERASSSENGYYQQILDFKILLLTFKITDFVLGVNAEGDQGC